MDKIILKPEQQTNTLRKYKGGYHEQLKDSDSEAYNALLRARNHLNYIKHSESIKQSQKNITIKKKIVKKLLKQPLLGFQNIPFNIHSIKHTQDF